MSYTLADFQANAKAKVYEAYATGARNVMLVLPTGAGKTVVMGSVAHEYAGFGCSIAHRSELVGQLSLALAREGLRHDIIAPDGVIRTIVAGHMEDAGRSYYDARAKWKVASVDTLVRRELPDSWLRQVGMVHMDEGHHALRENKWGRALDLFPNAYGLLPTASPLRADGKGLGRHADGVVDAMVEGPSMRWMIDNGHLTNYHCIVPPTEDLDMSDVPVTSSGEYNMDVTRKRVKASTKIVGDVVKMYLEYARGMKGITFAVDVEHAHTICEAYNKAGVPAAVVTAKSTEQERREVMRRFRKGDLMQLVNVDLFGEGVDVPDVQVVSMARPTASYSLFAQQFGRALRLLVSPILRAAWHTYSSSQRLQFIAESGKPRAIIIDHVGNVVKHMGPPDYRTIPWSLNARDKKRGVSDGIPMRACAGVGCYQPFLRIYPSCPYCGWTPAPPEDRSRPEFVDGDLMLLTTDMLQELFGARNKIDADEPDMPWNCDGKVAGRLRNIHAANKAAQHLLRDVMRLVLPPGVDERVANRRFFHTFGVDTLTAQGLTSVDAHALREKILAKLVTQ